MHPRPLYRLKSFWLGLLVMAFLGWAWRISFDYEALSYAGRISLYQSEGYVVIRDIADTGSIGAWTEKRSLDQYYSELAPMPCFLSGGHIRSDANWEFVTYRDVVGSYLSSEPIDRWVLMIPHWLLVLAFLLPWAAFLAWRWRKDETI